MSLFDKFLHRVKRAAELQPPLPGRANGYWNEVLNVDAVVLLVVDSRGRVFQIHNAEVRNGIIQPVHDGRTAVLKLLEEFDVQDVPDIKV